MVNSLARKTTIQVTQATNRFSNVRINQLQSICEEVLDTSTSQSNGLKNAMLSHLTDMNELMTTASYHDIERFKCTPLGGLARVLAGLCPYSAPIKGHPKLKGANKHGLPRSSGDVPPR